MHLLTTQGGGQGYFSSFHIGSAVPAGLTITGPVNLCYSPTRPPSAGFNYNAAEHR